MKKYGIYKRIRVRIAVWGLPIAISMCESVISGARRDGDIETENEFVGRRNTLLKIKKDLATVRSLGIKI